VGIFETEIANKVASFDFFEILAVKKNWDLKFFLKIFCQLEIFFGEGPITGTARESPAHTIPTNLPKMSDSDFEAA
jgi:hypothetical protein